MNGEQMINIDVLFGVKELQSRLRPAGAMIVGEGRSRTVDLDGNAGEWSEWAPTGVVMTYGVDASSKPWWKFWG